MNVHHAKFQKRLMVEQFQGNYLNLKSLRWPKYTQLGSIFQKKSCSTIKLFFRLKYVLHYTVLSKYLKKKSEVTVLI